MRCSFLPFFFLVACAGRAVIPPAVAHDAGDGVDNPSLRDLFAREWDYFLSQNPTDATTLADHRFDDRLEDPSWAHTQETWRIYDAFTDEAHAIPAASLSPRDRMFLEIYLAYAETRRAMRGCEMALWNVGPGGADPFEEMTDLADIQPVKTPGEGAKLLARYRAIPAWLDAQTANLRLGVARGKTASAGILRAAIKSADERIALRLEEWPLYTAAKAPHDDWPAAELTAWRHDLTSALEGARDAVHRYRDTLEHEVLPHARDEDHPGLVSLPGGLDCYRAAIHRDTSLPLEPDALFETGTAEVARAEKELYKLGERLFGTGDPAAIRERLRTDPALFYHSPEEIVQHAEQTIARTEAVLPKWFATLPRAKLVVRPMDPMESETNGTPFYQGANIDGSKPGEYRINITKPETRSRWDAENSAFHEALPGHHLQGSISQELRGVPAFLKHGGNAAFVEGWALYAERLADEMGLYSGDVDLLGMWAWDLIRGARLVVDTGLHARGWTPAQARQYFHDHTTLTDQDIALEVERYITSPGQALSYKVGDLTIRRLRKEAEEKLAGKFDVRAFHDVVLGAGTVTLEVLERRVHAWVEASSQSARP
jgi:uncharacterized protein (DUF885 family)